MGEISTKLQESSLNVMRTEEKYVMCKFVMEMQGLFGDINVTE